MEIDRLPTQLHSVQPQFFTKDLHFPLGRHGRELTAGFISLLNGPGYRPCFLTHSIQQCLYIWFGMVCYSEM